jgi:hypothetical protein
MVVVGVLSIPTEPLRWLIGLEAMSSPRWRRLRRRQKKIAIPARMAMTASTPTAIPTAPPVLSPWRLDVTPALLASGAVLGVGVTVTVCRLIVPPAVTVLTEVIGAAVV